MRILPLALLALCLPALASAQITIPVPVGDPAFDGPLTFTVLPVTNGMDYDLRGVEADPTRPGKEILIYLPTAGLVSVGRWHPTKHGVGGVLSGPGLCVEAWTTIAQTIGAWNFNTNADFTGDGLDDWIVYLQDGTVRLHPGRWLNVCR